MLFIKIIHFFPLYSIGSTTTCRYSNSIWVMFFSPQSFLTKLDLKNFSLWPPKDVTKNHEILIKKFLLFRNC